MVNGEGALGANREGVNGEGALKVGGGVLAGASMDAVRVCRKGSVICSSSDRGSEISVSPVSSPSPPPPLSLPIFLLFIILWVVLEGMEHVCTPCTYQ
jgi:hypothetical protein